MDGALSFRRSRVHVPGLPCVWIHGSAASAWATRSVAEGGHADAQCPAPPQCRYIGTWGAG
jgi:hypothetical protein